MSATDLQEYVRASDGDTEFVAKCYATASQLVTKHIGKAEVPNEVKAQATLEVGAELFHRRSAKNGVAQFATGDGQPVRVARDPMVAARATLAPFVGLGIS